MIVQRIAELFGPRFRELKREFEEIKGEIC